MTETQKEKLLKKRDQINARLQKITARENTKKRKADTTVKILLGAALLTRLKLEDDKAEDLLKWCRSVLSERDQVRLARAMEQRQ